MSPQDELRMSFVSFFDGISGVVLPIFLILLHFPLLSLSGFSAGVSIPDTDDAAAGNTTSALAEFRAKFSNFVDR